MRRPVSFVLFFFAAWLLQVFSLLPLFSDGNQTQARWLWRDTLRFSDRARERELIERSAGATSASTFKISSPPGSPCTCCLFRYEHATAPALTGRPNIQPDLADRRSDCSFLVGCGRAVRLTGFLRQAVPYTGDGKARGGEREALARNR